jgi:hypothetical protein
MNLKAKCVNRKCPDFDIQKSVLLGKFSGFGAPNDRVKCPHCGELMQTTESINVSTGKRTTKRSVTRKISGRTQGAKRTSKRTTKRTPKRGGGKRI